MTEAEPKPAATLSATLVRRSDRSAAPAAAGAAPTDHQLDIPPRSGRVDAGKRRHVSWRGAGIFGVLYLAALALFAAAFNMWPS